MPHNTKINAIFVDIKAGDCPIPVHIILILKLFLQINKIVTKSTQEGTGIKTPVLIFYSAGVKISRFLYTFALKIYQNELINKITKINMATTEIQKKDGGKLLNNMYELVQKGIPFVSEPVHELIYPYISRYGNTEKAIEKFVSNQKIKCATSGFVSGLGGALTMLVTIPADLASTIYIQLRMIAGIAIIRGYDINEDAVKTMVYLCLVGNSASQVLSEAGIKISEKIVIKKVLPLLNRKVTTAINQKIGFKLITKAGNKGVINVSKMIPILGGIIGGAWNWGEVAIVAKYAKKHFQ